MDLSKPAHAVDLRTVSARSLKMLVEKMEDEGIAVIALKKTTLETIPDELMLETVILNFGPNMASLPNFIKHYWRDSRVAVLYVAFLKGLLGVDTRGST